VDKQVIKATEKVIVVIAIAWAFIVLFGCYEAILRA